MICHPGYLFEPVAPLQEAILVRRAAASASKTRSWSNRHVISALDLNLRWKRQLTHPLTDEYCGECQSSSMETKQCFRWLKTLQASNSIALSRGSPSQGKAEEANAMIIQQKPCERRMVAQSTTIAPSTHPNEHLSQHRSLQYIATHESTIIRTLTVRQVQGHCVTRTNARSNMQTSQNFDSHHTSGARAL